MTTEYFVYHICREGDVANLSKGYIGITGNPKERWQSHRAGWSGSRVLKRAYDKYPDLVESIILSGSKELCLYTEAQLRPCKRVGWNLTEGGGLPPNHKGKVMSESQKANIGKSNSGANNSKWKGYWVVDGVPYESMLIACKALGCAKRTVRNRALSNKFPTWTFEESPTQLLGEMTNERCRVQRLQDCF